MLAFTYYEVRTMSMKKMYRNDQSREHWPDWTAEERVEVQARRRVSPGKVTLTMGMLPRRDGAGTSTIWTEQSQDHIGAGTLHEQLMSRGALNEESAPPARSPPRATGWPVLDADGDTWSHLARRSEAVQSGGPRASGVVQGKGLEQLPTNEVSIEPTSSGASLPGDVRTKMEAALGMDFSGVRIHVGPQAESVGALAFTRGLDIFFAPREYQPSSPRGQELIGHELTHVVQQSEGRVTASTMAGGVAINHDTGLEREADVMGARAAAGERQEPTEKSHSPRVPTRAAQALRVPVQRSAARGVIQRAATVAGAPLGGNQLVNERALIRTDYQRATIPFGPGLAVRERISVYGDPGFGTNLGHINGNGNNEVRPSVQGVAHTEPILIGRSYHAAGGNPNWGEANTRIDLVNNLHGGAAARDHFALFTERHPCDVCGPQLANARYHADDTVVWSFQRATGTRDIAASHIARAQAQFPGYAFAVDADRPWRRCSRSGSESRGERLTPARKRPKQVVIARKGREPAMTER